MRLLANAYENMSKLHFLTSSENIIFRSHMITQNGRKRLQQKFVKNHTDQPPMNTLLILCPKFDLQKIIEH